MLQVLQFKCLNDNYGFLIKEMNTNKALCVDTPDAAEIISYAHKNNLVISEVWNTHWHADHAGGNQAIKDEFGAILKGPEEVVKHGFPLDEIITPESEISFGGQKAKILNLGGHTLGQIGYYFADSKMVFVGDAIFVLGCGRLFEGDARLAWGGLENLKKLPPETLVYCAHEYSAANAKFCASLGLSNPDLKARIEEIETLSAQKIPTVPTTIATELKTNPFLLADYENLKSELGQEGKEDFEIYGYIRGLKDKF
jgi:hydroxyacylglutathione hydrolase